MKSSAGHPAPRSDEDARHPVDRLFAGLSIKWRLAGASAALTFVILCVFAIAVGELTTSRIRSDFDNQLAATADDLAGRVVFLIDSDGIHFDRPNLDAYAAPENAVIRVVTLEGAVLKETRDAPNLGFPPRTTLPLTLHGYRVATREKPLPGASIYVQYGRKASDVTATVGRVTLFLILGVLGGTGLALIAGLMVSRRAMSPIAQLTETAREIERTRDPTLRVAVPAADDEVAELARTLDGMLQALAASRSETEAMLQRQREFVADASHELRTPLTSVLANLEVLAESLDGDRGDAARSALRSSRRMRRLVADLLLLARADARRPAPRTPTDVADVVIEAAAELQAVTDGHELIVDTEPAIVDGARDELHRLATNLMENALRHTPSGTNVRAQVRKQNGRVTLAVEDDGPGIPPELEPRVFERFVRGAGDTGGSFGLGLSIVQAVAASHGGDVTLEHPAGGHGARFVVRLPAG